MISGVDQPSTSKEAAAELKTQNRELNATGEEKEDNENAIDDADLDKMMTVEEFLQKSKTYMIDYEKHMFLDTIDSDCLVVCAK